MFRAFMVVPLLAFLSWPWAGLDARPKGRSASQSAADGVTHPLDPLTAVEHSRTYQVVRAHFAASAALPDEALLFPYVALDEPPKASVIGWDGGAFTRRSTIHVLHPPSNRTWIATVDLQSDTVTHLELVTSGQPAVTAEEFAVADELVHAYEPWQEAMRAWCRAQGRLR